MVNYKVSGSILLFLFSSCYPPQDQNIEIQAINDIFLKLIGTDYYYAPIPPPPYRPLNPDNIIEVRDEEDSAYYQEERERYHADSAKFDWATYQAELAFYDSIRSKPSLDTLNLVILLHDSLVVKKPYDFLTRILSPDGFKRNFQVDTTWRSLAIGLLTLKSSRLLDIDKIKNVGRYSIKNESTYVQSHDDRVIGRIGISRVYFNEEYSRGCLYYSFICRGDCGYGELVFIELVNGVWKVAGLRELWVA